MANLVQATPPNAAAKRATVLSEQLVVALDLPTADAARALVARLGDSVRFYKIGLELQFTGGLDLARELIDAGKRVFLDAKLGDIDRTVEAAVRNIATMGVDMVTVVGTESTVRAALRGRGAAALKIFALTVLTHVDTADLRRLGITASTAEAVLFYAETALAAGADGVVASGREVAQIRQLAGNRLLIAVPGIRSADVAVAGDDQKRTTTPAQAIAAGADLIVVGRQILRADDPKAMAERILAEMAGTIDN